MRVNSPGLPAGGASGAAVGGALAGWADGAGGAAAPTAGDAGFSSAACFRREASKSSSAGAGVAETFPKTPVALEAGSAPEESGFSVKFLDSFIRVHLSFGNYTIQYSNTIPASHTDRHGEFHPIGRTGRVTVKGGMSAVVST